VCPDVGAVGEDEGGDQHEDLEGLTDARPDRILAGRRVATRRSRRSLLSATSAGPGRVSGSLSQADMGVSFADMFAADLVP
jgi:hypothetical protein